MMAPGKAFPDLNGGAYAVYDGRQPVRVRANQLRGDHAVLSGLFLDP